MNSTMPSDQKLCIHCKVRIERTANRCPHCQMWQSRFLVDPTHPRTMAILSAVIVLGFLAICLATYQLVLEMRETNKIVPTFDHGIVVQEIHVRPLESWDTYKKIAVYGTLKNTSNHKWTNLVFQIEIHDQSGKLIDAIAQRAFSTVLAPHTEGVFRLEEDAIHPAKAYASVKIVSLSAKPFIAKADE